MAKPPVVAAFFSSPILSRVPLSVGSLTSTAASAASAALCAAVFLGLADAATERRAGGGEPTERRRKCDAATDDDDSGARCCFGADGGVAAAVAAAATARRGAPNELLATPPRVATTAGCCIFNQRRARVNEGGLSEMETPQKKKKEPRKNKMQANKKESSDSLWTKKKKERKESHVLSHAPLPGLPRGVRGPDRLPPGPAGHLRRQGRAERQQSLGGRREPVSDDRFANRRRRRRRSKKVQPRPTFPHSPPPFSFPSQRQPNATQLTPHLEAQRPAKVPLALRGGQARPPPRDDDRAAGDRQVWRARRLFAEHEAREA